MRILKIIATDIAGVCLIILAALTGWLPGPGGIPLFLAGLGLLSINHEWARRLLKHVKTHGVRFINAFFREHRLWMLAYDIFAVLLVGFGIIVLAMVTGRVVHVIAISGIFMGAGLFLGNRKRLHVIYQYFRRLNHYVRRRTKREP